MEGTIKGNVNVFPCSECGSEIGVRDERDWIEHQADGSHKYYPHSPDSVEGDRG